MKTKPKPTRTTVVYGVLAAVAFTPLMMALGGLIPGISVFRLIIWLYLTIYAILLARWAGRGLAGIALPLFLLLIPVIWAIPTTAYLLLCLATLSWIRSGVLFRNLSAGRFAAEAALCLGGGLAVAGFQPQSTVSWALGILMFFLLQAAYFALFNVPGQNAQNRNEIDPFDTARKAAEKILTETY